MIIWLATWISYALNVNDILKHCNKVLLNHGIQVFIFLWKVRSGMVAKWWSRWAHNPKVRGSKPRYAFFFFNRDSMAEWIMCLTTDQEIPGSSPGRVDKIFFFWKHRVSISKPLACKASALPIELYPVHVQHTFIWSLQSSCIFYKNVSERFYTRFTTHAYCAGTDILSHKCEWWLLSTYISSEVLPLE